MKSYGLDYVAGSNARKLEYEEVDEKIYKVARKKQVEKQTHVMSSRQKVQLVATVVVVFSMLMVIIYRSNKISEANLRVIELKEEYEDVSSDLSLAMMNVEQKSNLTEIEAYAKQKLGMQKPDKNQIVYVDTSAVEKVEIQSSNEVASKNILNSVWEFFSIKK